MSQFIFLAGYCIFSIAISAAARKLLRTTWVYLLVSTLLPPMIFVGGSAVWDGHLDAWSDIAFAVSTLISLACAVGYYIVWRILKRDGKPNGASASPGATR